MDGTVYEGESFVLECVGDERRDKTGKVILATRVRRGGGRTECKAVLEFSLQEEDDKF